MYQNSKKMYMTPLKQFVFLSYWDYIINSKYRIKTTRKWDRLTASKKIYKYFNHTLYRNKAFPWAIHHHILKTPTEYTYPSSRDWYMYIAPEVQAHNYAWLFTSTCFSQGLYMLQLGVIYIHLMNWISKPRSTVPALGGSVKQVKWLPSYPEKLFTCDYTIRYC